MFIFYIIQVMNNGDLSELNGDDGFVKLMEDSGMTVRLTVRSYQC